MVAKIAKLTVEVDWRLLEDQVAEQVGDMALKQLGRGVFDDVLHGSSKDNWLNVYPNAGSLEVSRDLFNSMMAAAFKAGADFARDGAKPVAKEKGKNDG